jgi:radical SAM protein with 4Fe4S-binding SPASM domain
MPLNTAKNIIKQGVELGLKSIVYLGGGEPTLYPYFWDLIEYMYINSVIPVIFTNGLLIDDYYAQKLKDLGASVIVKFDGYESTQNILTGPGSFKKIRNALDTFIKYGFNELIDGRYTRLGAAPCMCQQNYSELPVMWKFLRENNIFPDFERATTIGNATNKMSLNNDEVYDILEKFKQIDIELGLNDKWDVPYTSLPAHNCHIFLSGCHITADEMISLCPELPPIANLKDRSLKEILNSEPFNKTRYIENHIEGECKECDYLDKCFGGCRSKAFYDSNSLYSSDPFCPIVNKKMKISE